MRLTAHQISAIKRHTRAVFGADAVVYPLGSRTNDARPGGDVDLLIELPQKGALADEIKLIARLERDLSLPVDVLTPIPRKGTGRSLRSPSWPEHSHEATD